MRMLCHVDSLPLRFERQKKLCLFCCFVFSLARLIRLAAIKAWLRLFRPGSELIGIALLEHLGDIVASEPIVRQLRRDAPNAFIVWCVGAPYHEIADSHPDNNMTIALRFLSEWVILNKCGLFDKVIDLHLPGRICSTCKIAHHKTAGSHQINSENYYSFGNLLSVMAKNAGINVPTEGPLLHIPPGLLRKIDSLALPSRFICLHCTSNEDARNWDNNKWHELVRTLIETYQFNVIEVGLRPALAGLVHSHYISLCGRLSIMETAEVIRRAAVFVGIDSGPAHLANAVGTFGIILLGQYRAFPNYMPYSGAYGDGSNARIIRYDCPANAIPIEPVLEELLIHMSGYRDDDMRHSTQAV